MNALTVAARPPAGRIDRDAVRRATRLVYAGAAARVARGELLLPIGMAAPEIAPPRARLPVRAARSARDRMLMGAALLAAIAPVTGYWIARHRAPPPSAIIIPLRPATPIPQAGASAPATHPEMKGAARPHRSEPAASRTRTVRGPGASDPATRRLNLREFARLQHGSRTVVDLAKTPERGAADRRDRARTRALNLREQRRLRRAG